MWYFFINWVDIFGSDKSLTRTYKTLNWSDDICPLNFNEMGIYTMNRVYKTLENKDSSLDNKK